MKRSVVISFVDAPTRKHIQGLRRNPRYSSSSYGELPGSYGSNRPPTARLFMNFSNFCQKLRNIDRKQEWAAEKNNFPSYCT